MKFIIHLGPVVPATPEERERLRPIMHRTDRVQMMLEEMVEISQMAEAAGFSVITYSEHQFFSDGFIGGSNPTPHLLHLASKTKKIKIGPLGYVLPTWDPIRLALDVAWADQITQGRAVAGFARGVFPHWVNTLGQRYGVKPSVLGKEEELHNREVSQELFEIIKLSWKDEPFSFDGKYYKVPFPFEGMKWPAAEAARRYGAPGEIDDDGWLRKVSPVPKPFQKPHQLLLQAMTMTPDTIAWTAREGIVPMIFLPFPNAAVASAELYHREANAAGRNFKFGENVGLARIVSIDRSKEAALEIARRGIMYLLGLYHSHFYPTIPKTIEPVVDAGIAFCGTKDDVRAQIAAVQEKMNPEYFLYFCDQGLLPLDEVKQQVERFADVMQEFRDDDEVSSAPASASIEAGGRL